MVTLAQEDASGAVPRRVEIVYEVPGTDPRWVLEEENVPESALHDEIIFLQAEVARLRAELAALRRG